MNNKKNTKGPTTQVSKSAEKKSDVLIQIDEIMGDLEGEYGPLMIQELQNRLMKTVSDFKDDLKSVLTETFNQHNKKIELSDGEESDESDVPTYIADYEKKKNLK
tara:strand:+ start:344 stop:658 length:315 start_codon:yes stop_codon:yes gene_type:complete